MRSSRNALALLQQGLKQRLVFALGIEDTASLRCWVRRLFLPPHQDKSGQPGMQADLPHGGGAFSWLARELGVRNLHRRREWLLRLFVMPPPARSEARAIPAPRAAAKPIAVPAPRSPSRLALLLLAWRDRLVRWRPPQWLADGWRIGYGYVDGHPAVVALRRRFATSKAVVLMRHAAPWLAPTDFLARSGLLAGILVLAIAVATTPLTYSGQLAFCLLTLLAALYAGRMKDRWPPLLLLVFSLTVTARYAWWRVGNTLVFDDFPGLLCGVLLLMAEMGAWGQMAAGYFRFLRHGTLQRPGHGAVQGVFILAPLAWLAFGIQPYNAPVWTVALYLVPHWLHAAMAQGRIRQSHGSSLWAATGRSALESYAALPQPWLVPASLLGVMLGLARLLAGDTREPDNLLFYWGWASFNLVMLCVSSRLGWKRLPHDLAAFPVRWARPSATQKG